MRLQEIKEALAQGEKATRSAWESGTFITCVPEETDMFEKTLPDGSKEEYNFGPYDQHEIDWEIVQ
jgi:hypothetical protein